MVPSVVPESSLLCLSTAELVKFPSKASSVRSCWRSGGTGGDGSSRGERGAAKHLQDLLMESVNFSPASLSSTGSRYLNALVDSAVVLETKDTSLAKDLKKAELHLCTERARVDSRLQNMDFLKAKSEEFRSGIRTAEEQLSARGMDASLSHQSLVALSEKLAELKRQTMPLKKKLESYLDLMPNTIEAELTKRVNMMEL
uniref:HAUS augmin like complex subunit 1 n=1 Tax=Bos indicus x Bos taurus TaxID=30522 RepID=A0A4W2FWE3_BOBOX